MDTAAELTALKEEVAQLKQQLAEFRHFLTIQDLDEPPGQKILTLRCSGVFLQNPEQPDQLQGMWTAAADGPSLALWGSDNRPRLTLDVEKDRGALRLYQKDTKTAVEIAENDNNHSHVAVFHEGRPRAQMKGTPDHGIISAIHDDGQTRVTMTSELGHGDILVVGGDMKPAVKLSSEGRDGGGFLTVNHANGQAAVILTSTPVGGGVILNDSRGQIIDSLPSPTSGEDENGEE